METYEMTIADKLELVKGRAVDMHRNWNNSMYIYSDSATIYNPATMGWDTIHLGIDFWDAVSFDSVKASDCIVALYSEFKRGEVEMGIRDERNRISKEVQKLGWVRADQIDWFLNLPRDRRENVMKLFKSNLRSEFRKSLRDQIGTWLSAIPTARKYDSPLSPKQWGFIGPFRPYR